MDLDIRPFWLIGALGACGFGLLVLVVRKAYPDYLGRVLLLWGAANLCLGASYISRLARPWDGQFIFHVLGCTLATSCLTFEYWALRELKRLPSSIFWILVPPSLMFVASVWFTFVQRNITVELLILNFIDMALMMLIAFALLEAEEGRRPFADLVTAFVYALLAIITGGVIIAFLGAGNFTPEYDFNRPRSIFNGVVAIIAEGIVFPLFLLMVSERLNRYLVIQAMHDPLTGLYNRRAFEEIAFREISGAARAGLGISVMVFDIDHFKQVNDKHGHTVGDAVLNTAAATLRQTLRDEDFLCRWGGDEFCALLPRARREQAQHAAERILQAFHELNFSLHEKSIPIAISIGIVTAESHSRNLSLLIERADAALYRAKEAGRNQFAFAADVNLESDQSNAPQKVLAGPSPAV
jgi:diguanylate cyclase (GGDEF)-like protein